jgi:hypothetical protein
MVEPESGTFDIDLLALVPLIRFRARGTLII